MGDLAEIFKAYDIRGRTDVDLDADAAYRIGAAFADFVAAPRIAVGRDCRASSPELSKAFAKGALAQAVDVADLGEIPTDAAYYYSGFAGVPAAMITASHNPPDWNGIKLSDRGAAPIGEDSGLAEIRSLAEEGLAASGEGTLSRIDPMPGYIDHLLDVVDADVIKPLHVVADAGNGMAGPGLEMVFEGLDAVLIGLYLEPDGTFPNHPADPLRPENLTDLLDKMSELEPDLGVAFDGDADRAFFVDDQRRPVSGSTTTAIIASWFLGREPGAKVVHNLICSRAVPESILAAGGVPIRTRVGHSFIKQVMAESGAVFGGEHSGHYYFRDNYRADSGMLAMLVLLQVISEAGRSLSELRKQYEPYAQSGEINMEVEDHSRAMSDVQHAIDGGVVDLLDGLTMSWPDRWFNLRPSNTEPVLRLNAEATDSDAVDSLVALVRDAVGVQG